MVWFGLVWLVGLVWFGLVGLVVVRNMIANDVNDLNDTVHDVVLTQQECIEWLASSIVKFCALGELVHNKHCQKVWKHALGVVEAAKLVQAFDCQHDMLAHKLTKQAIAYVEQNHIPGRQALCRAVVFEKKFSLRADRMMREHGIHSTHDTYTDMYFNATHNPHVTHNILTNTCHVAACNQSSPTNTINTTKLHQYIKPYNLALN